MAMFIDIYKHIYIYKLYIYIFIYLYGYVDHTFESRCNVKYRDDSDVTRDGESAVVSTGFVKQPPPTFLSFL